ncbi:MAG TPA: LysM peptidoglycan-binding domain-containing protein [Gemmatimonadaceae bacterium]|nr:LysM peptidoglycan-binding domain-containing protein [Gemmatimonadaceae bacterium]
MKIRTTSVAVAAALVFALLGTTKVGAQEANPSAHTVKRGDTLWDLAKLYLGDSFMWPEIYRLNTDIIDDPHWIYPGEVLKLPAPGATPTVAEAPPVKQAGEPMATVPPPTAAPVQVEAPVPGAPAPTPVASSATGTPIPVYEPPPVLDGPTVFPRQRFDMAPSKRKKTPAAPMPTVTLGTFVSAPFVDRGGGPRGYGHIQKVVNLSVTLSGQNPKQRAQLNDEVFVAPPAGSAAAEGDRYVTYTLGPTIEGIGQVVVPTGVIEVTRAPRDREAAVAKVIKMFGEIQADQRLLPYDSTSLHIFGHPEPVRDSIITEVKLVPGMPILPGLQDYLVIEVTSHDGIKIGDEFELFVPHQRSWGAEFADPAIPIARAQAVRVTPYATTLMITGERHPKIEVGTLVRRVATMP